MVKLILVFEARPGELWITTMQGGLRVKLDERDFVKPTAARSPRTTVGTSPRRIIWTGAR